MCETINMTATDQPEPAVSDFMGNVMAVAALAYYAPMFIAFGDAGYTLFHQLRDWLRTGVWVPHELWQACAYWFSLTERPHLSWVVPDRIMWWALTSSRWLSMTFIGFILFAFETWVMIRLVSAFESARLARSQKATRSN